MLHYKAYNENQDNTRIPLIFLHGLLGEKQNWNSQAQHFANTYKVITVDLRNHGESPHIKGMSYRQMADDVMQLLMHLDISQAHLCGHSMGGKVAMYIALTHPEIIHKLLVVDIAPVPYPLWHQPIFQALLSLPISQLSHRREVDKLLARDIEDPFERGFLLKNLKRGEKGYQWKCDLPEIARNYLKIAGFPEQKTAFEGATLYIKGANSPYITEAHHTFIFNYFPTADIAIIAHAGHLPHVQQPIEFSKVLMSFLRG